MGGYNRVCTMLVYLNECVCEKKDSECFEDINGCTLFPLLSLAVPPVQNAALFWTNTDANLKEFDAAVHQGLPVCCGEKWAMNIWIHARDLWNYGTVLDKIRGLELQLNKEYLDKHKDETTEAKESS
eukprot:NODE_2161_length_663_cov_168.429967_g1821_i0.p2 GENE.NODE_2161_length_663_cov_168.429967_g1821_i0~~NODE_2161_length_663_cov_168.429967_g1821_i0.p2  ORF type:complete len:135 (-),score=62.36 NODE_2161_length_663_cov_168.429967_g1821_i0:258-638(-)